MARGEMCVDPVEQVQLLSKFLFARFRGGSRFLAPFLQCIQVGQGEFQFEHRDVLARIELAGFVRDVRVLKAARDHRNGIYISNMPEKLVAESLAFVRVLDQARDIHNLQCRWRDFIGMDEIAESVEAGIGDGDDADVRFDRREGIAGHGGVGARQRIEERGFARIWKTDETEFECHRVPPVSYKTLYHKSRTQRTLLCLGELWYNAPRPFHLKELR